MPPIDAATEEEHDHMKLNVNFYFLSTIWGVDHGGVLVCEDLKI